MFLIRLRRLLKSVGRDVLQLFYAFRHPSTPRGVKVGALLLLAYIVSPLDLIPEWLPVIGLADDITIAALVIPFLLRQLPTDAKLASESSSRNFFGRFWRS